MKRQSCVAARSAASKCILRKTWNTTSKNRAKGRENHMCGRYYVDDETAREIEKLVETVNDKLRLERLRKDIHPTDEAPVLVAGDREMKLEWQHWGFPNFQGKGVIFNARSEAVLEKKMFRESILHRRIIIPCTWFYEWNRKKEKVTFYREDAPVIFLAGFYNVFGDEKRFTVLTTEANQSMVSTHDRMPLIVEPDQLKDWVLDDIKFSGILKQTPVLLDTKQEYDQQELKFL